jgi:hypothetical protein
VLGVLAEPSVQSPTPKQKAVLVNNNNYFLGS